MQWRTAGAPHPGPDATQGDLIEITVDFSATPGIIEVAPYYEPRCEFAADVLDGQLPSTGNSSIVLISSAAAALLAGAVVFFLLHRRKTEANWE